MDHALHDRLRAEELTDAILDGAAVYGPDDEKVGAISHLHGSGPDGQAIVEVGGILGIGARPVALALRDLDLMRDLSGTVHAVTRYSKDELKRMPEHHH
ncbi:PRC-barrel domain containing protein [Paracoccus aestuariivivens]|uniref:PRC-barrel domain containing protein n=1 Tax=Paracoccus aestuariivivens TaxID=1820333 RepID=A0A6L6J462_9RHOB|nr:PRC-barrel domain containing protein [Paracoccus aestuariivivens]MTH76903.1 PRC-barrel domain containing protein [Paracoccus aestuariivivens]